jgi:NAD(P)-dependent dehydrogenase (short-subunit alcohol dehydrogenase family)
MKKSTAYTALGIAAGAIAYALLPRPSRLRAGQVAVITGGSRGLGLALAHRFGRAGLKLVLCARDEQELEVARHILLHSGDVRHEDDILLVVCDITDPAQAAGLVDQAIRTFGSLDVLINNAGIMEVGPVEAQPLEAYRRAMDTNFFGALHTILAAMPHLLEHGGAIVNISSIGGKIPLPHMAPYVASKFALTGFSELLHAELRHSGVRVTTVCPGLMRSGGEAHASFTGQVEKEQAWFNFAAKTPLVAATVEHVANRIFSATDTGRAEITITPQAWLAARIQGVAPAASQQVASLASEYILPKASPTQPAHLNEPALDAEAIADPSAS